MTTGVTQTPGHDQHWHTRAVLACVRRYVYFVDVAAGVVTINRILTTGKPRDGGRARWQHGDGERKRMAIVGD